MIRSHSLLLTAALICTCAPSFGQQVSRDAAIQELVLRLDAQEAEIRELRSRLEQQQGPTYGPVSSGKNTCCDCRPPLRRFPVVAEDCWQPSCKSSEPPKQHTIRWEVGYDGGFVIRPLCPERNPFEVKFNGWGQFRYHGFSRDVDSWTDNAGITRPVRNRSAFDVERARLVLSGYALDERLTYFVQLDGDTDGSHAVDFFDYWWAWECSDRFQIQMGKRKVPGSRQWLLGARRTRLVDRPMACDFFRPDRTVGIFGVGQMGDRGHYELMVGNGYRTANLPNSVTDDRLTYAMTNYFDLGGDYGGQLVDYDFSCEPLIRFGHSFVYSPQGDEASGTPLGEATFLRLTDGTVLTQTGALAPGVTVSEFDIYLYSVDFAAKWRGWSLDAEAYFRWIEDIRGNGALPVNDLFQRGFFVEGGCFLVPKKLDFNVRYSQINGFYGDSTEYAIGSNWYPLDTHKMKLTLDVTKLDGSSLNNTTSDILVGDDGVLVRTQFQAEF